MRNSNRNMSMMAATLLLASATGMAETGSVTGNVTRVMIDGTGNYGGCMAKISVPPSSKLPSCGPSWVTFSCTGNFAVTTVQAYRLFDQAQMALAANKQVVVYFRDDQKHNGYCFAFRVDVM
jgi:hypothetical protein